MGCTHSKNSKSKAAKQKEERPLDRSLPRNRVSHFDETQQTTQSTSNESSDEKDPPVQYSKGLLNETGGGGAVEETTMGGLKESGAEIKSVEGKKAQTAPTNGHLQSKPSEVAPDAIESLPPTALPPSSVHQQQPLFVASTYYPMPTVGEKQKSPEKKRQRKKEPVFEEKRKKEHPRDKSGLFGPNGRPQLTAEDLECIKRAVQQRNERRAYMMANRNERDDTLYELEARMPEKDYTHRSVSN